MGAHDDTKRSISRPKIQTAPGSPEGRRGQAVPGGSEDLGRGHQVGVEGAHLERVQRKEKRRGFAEKLGRKKGTINTGQATKKKNFRHREWKRKGVESGGSDRPRSRA